MSTVSSAPREGLLADPRWQQLLGALAALIAGLATVHYALAPWRGRADEMIRYPYSNSMMTDFRDTVMLPAKALERGMNPYDIDSYVKVFDYSQEFNPYMPWWLSVTGPLEHLGWSHATLIYSVALALGTSALAAIAGAVAARRLGHVWSSQVHPRWWVMASVTVAWVWIWRPTSIGQGLGNVGAFAALSSLLALAVRSRWGVIFLALAWVKPQFGIPLVIILVMRRQWRQAVAGTLLAGILSLPMIIRLTGIAGGFPELVRSVLAATTWVGEREGGEPFMGRVDLAGLLEALGLGLGSLIPMLIGAVVVAVAARLSVRLDEWKRPALALLLVVSALLVGFPHLHYDLPMLAPLVPWALLEAWQCHGAWQWRDPGAWLPLVLVPVGLASDHLLPQAFPVSRFGGVVALTIVITLAVLAARQDPWACPADSSVFPRRASATET